VVGSIDRLKARQVLYRSKLALLAAAGGRRASASINIVQFFIVFTLEYPVFGLIH